MSLICYYKPKAIEVAGAQTLVQPLVEVRTMGYPTFWMGAILIHRKSPSGAFFARIEGQPSWITTHECPRAVIAELPRDEYDHLYDADVPSIDMIERECMSRWKGSRRAWTRQRSLGEDEAWERRAHHDCGDMLHIVRSARLKRKTTINRRRTV